MEVDSEPRTSSTATASERTDQIEPSTTTAGASGSSEAAPREDAGQDQQPADNTLAPGQIPEEYRDILGGTFKVDAFICTRTHLNIEIPDGVDPAFLAALPEDIRGEVIRDHIRQQRVQRATQRAAPAPAPAGDATATAAAPADGAAPQDGAPAAELDQEFLAALPPELQEEVLAQHEQRVAQQNRQQAAPVNDVDPAALFDSLPPSLRAQVLADADDSVLQILPPNLVAEATRLRANMEQQVTL